jgi:hypothetical protein
MKTFKRLEKAFTTWKNLLSVSNEGTMNMAVINPHAQGQGMLGSAIGTTSVTQWTPPQATISSMPYATNNGNMTHFTVEKVDNGFILRAGRFNGDIAKTKVCSSMDEVKDLFVAVLVEYQLDK